MKKLLLFLLTCLIIIPCLSAENPFDEQPQKKPFGFSNRMFEMGFSTDVVFSNNFLTIGDIFFSETLVLDLDRLNSGFRISFGLGVTPFYFNVNSKDDWGFGLSTNVDAIGILGLPGNLLSFGSANNSQFDLGGAVFATTQASAFFHVQKFKVTVQPTLFYTAVNMKIKRDVDNDFSFTFNNEEEGPVINIRYDDIRLYSAIPIGLDSGFNLDMNSISGSPGFDLTFSVEYPLSEVLGINEILPFLDFDVGVQLSGLPLFPSTLHNYLKIEGRIGSTDPIILGDLDGDFNLEDIMNNFIPEFYISEGEEKANFWRPFKFFAWANWRPLLGSNLITVTPIIGFSVDQIYNNKAAFEGGLNATLNLANILYVTAGINYFDRIWINSLALGVNLKLIQLDVGIDMRSQSFIRSWSASGIGVNFGLRFGF
ncbi:MAG: hypothetical protein FWD13_08675 [Treponema sp.]|nr:hypothetical protein [Treponema sp.]